MSLSPALQNREFDKFTSNSDGDTAVRVVAEISGSSLPISVTIDSELGQQILNANDRNDVFTWANFGTKNERVLSIEYSAPSVTIQTLTKTFNYTLSSGSYRLDSIVFTLA